MLNTASSKQVTKQPHTKPLWQQIWDHRMEYLLISPFFIIYGIFHFYPLMWALWLSLHRWQGVGKMRWIFMQNYERLLTNAKTFNALGNSLIFLLFLLPIIVIATLLIASMLNSPQVKGRTVFRMLFFLPYITSLVIVVIIFQLLLQENFGWVNGILEAIGLPRVRWFSEVWPRHGDDHGLLECGWLQCPHHAGRTTGYPPRSVRCRQYRRGWGRGKIPAHHCADDERCDSICVDNLHDFAPQFVSPTLAAVSGNIWQRASAGCGDLEYHPICYGIQLCPLRRIGRSGLSDWHTGDRGIPRPIQIGKIRELSRQRK